MLWSRTWQSRVQRDRDGGGQAWPARAAQWLAVVAPTPWCWLRHTSHGARVLGSRAAPLMNMQAASWKDQARRQAGGRGGRPGFAIRQQHHAAGRPDCRWRSSPPHGCGPGSRRRPRYRDCSACRRVPRNAPHTTLVVVAQAEDDGQEPAVRRGEALAVAPSTSSPPEQALRRAGWCAPGSSAPSSRLSRLRTPRSSRCTASANCVTPRRPRRPWSRDAQVLGIAL